MENLLLQFNFDRTCASRILFHDLQAAQSSYLTCVASPQVKSTVKGLSTSSCLAKSNIFTLLMTRRVLRSLHHSLIYLFIMLSTCGLHRLPRSIAHITSRHDRAGSGHVGRWCHLKKCLSLHIDIFEVIRSNTFPNTVHVRVVYKYTPSINIPTNCSIMPSHRISHI